MSVPTLVSAEWLQHNVNQPNVIVLYTRMADIQSGEIETLQGHVIPGARLFDFEQQFVDIDSSLPHTMPSVAHFEQQARQLGLNNDDHLIVYDSLGIFCSARVWWMLRSMGHQRVSVLNGGLPAWLAKGGEVTDTLTEPCGDGDFIARFNPQAWINSQTILQQLNTDKPPIIADARSAERFYGLQPEPRDGVRRGHIPSARSLPFNTCIKNGYLASTAVLASQFNDIDIDIESNCIFSCGSGVTACILALAAHQLGYNNICVYDGSWADWGSDLRLPISLSKE